MQYKLILIGIGLLCLSLFLSPASAFDIRDGDNLVISSPVSDDLLISGNVVTINAPVKSVTFAGGELIVNAPVEGNLLAAGGRIEVNAPIGADLIAAGGEIVINSDISGKVIAAGGGVTMNGTASNLAISGGTVRLAEESHISGDALISSSGYETLGEVDGRLQAEGEQGKGSSAFDLSTAGTIIGVIVTVFQILFAIGMLILGVILIRLIPVPFRAVTTVIREKTLYSLVLGVSGMILSVIVIIALVITLAGIPIALISGLMLLIGLIISPLVTGAALGLTLAEKMEKTLSLTRAFIAGYIILEILFLIPVIGFIIRMLVVFTGLGALMMVVRENTRAAT